MTLNRKDYLLIIGIFIILHMTLLFGLMNKVSILEKENIKIKETIVELQNEIDNIEDTKNNNPIPFSLDTQSVIINTNNILNKKINDTAEKKTISDNIYKKSNLTSDEINNIIEKNCDKYKINPNKFIVYNHTDTLKYVEDKYNINALYLLSIFRVESGLDSSIQSIETNNPGSIMIKNKHNNYILKEYDSIDNHIIELAELLTNTYKNEYNCMNIYDINKRYCPSNLKWSNQILNFYSEFKSYI